MLTATQGAAFGPVEFRLRNTDGTPPDVVSAEVRLIDGDRVVHASTVANSQIAVSASTYRAWWSMPGAVTADLDVGTCQAVLLVTGADGETRRSEWDGIGAGALWLQVLSVPGGVP